MPEAMKTIALLLALMLAIAACTPDGGDQEPATQPTATARIGDDATDDDGDDATDDPTGDGVTDPTGDGVTGDTTGDGFSETPSASPSN